VCCRVRRINPSLSQVLVVGAGGFIGSALRFLIGGWVQRLAVAGVFPFGTLVVNVIGCLLIGFLGGLAESRQIMEYGHRLFLMVGVLGGFTTYSAFALETLSLMNEGAVARALANMLLHLLLGFAAAAAGFFSVRYF
jgi:CrcB protein